jgi:hypothetical protein
MPVGNSVWSGHQIVTGLVNLSRGEICLEAGSLRGITIEVLPGSRRA